jgi:hypothetical protein
VQGAKVRLVGSLDNDLKLSGSSLVDVTGTGRLTLLGQAVRTRFDGVAPESWGAAATLRGGDYVATARLKDGPEAGLSYNQRLAPGSRVTLGGEVLASLPALAAASAAAAGPRSVDAKPIEWALGAAYEGENTKVREGGGRRG